MSTKHSKRITLGTYILNEEGRPVLWNSFAEGEYESGGLREALRDAARISGLEDQPEAYRNGERGICVAAYSVHLGTPSRVIATFPWDLPPVACFEAQGPFCTDPWNLTHTACA